MQEDGIRTGAVIANYNGGRFFINCLDGLLSQTRPLDKIILIDDGSTDDSIEIIDFHAMERDMYLKGNFASSFLEKNKGPSFARNMAIKQLVKEVDIIFIADIDDIYYPTKVEESVKIMAKYPEVALVYSDYDTESIDGRINREFKETYSYKRLREECIVGSNSAIASKIFDIVGLYDESIRYGEDYDLWLRISEVAGIYHIPKALYRYRMTGQNVTTTTPSEKYAQDIMKVKQKARERENAKQL